MTTMLWGARVACAGLILALVAGLGVQAAPPVAGAIFTTNADCTQVNGNIYASRMDVYLNGGPKKPGAAGLPNGSYYVKVTEPNGTLLGSSTLTATPKPITVVNGEFAQCYQLWAIVNKASAPSEQGYDATGNNGGEYKVWVSNESSFANNSSKTDNFKVREPVLPPPPPETDILVYKFYDLNLDGDWDSLSSEPAIAGWPMELRLASDNSLVNAGVTDSNGLMHFIVPRDGTEYIVTEVMQQPYINTTPLSQNVITTPTTESVVVAFGNVAIQCHLGLGRTRGFWGASPQSVARYDAAFPEWAQRLNALCLVDNDGNALVLSETDAVAARNTVRAWYTAGGPEDNMAHKLSIQLATTALNVYAGFMSDAPGVFVDWDGQRRNIEEVFAIANALLCANPVVTTAGTIHDDMEELKDFFDHINMNLTTDTHVYLVLPGPVPFGPLGCVGGQPSE